MIYQFDFYIYTFFSLFTLASIMTYASGKKCNYQNLLELEHSNYNIGEQVEIAAFALIPKSTVLQEVLSD